jgi:hypothetical protein
MRVSLTAQQTQEFISLLKSGNPIPSGQASALFGDSGQIFSILVIAKNVVGYSLDFIDKGNGLIFEINWLGGVSIKANK